MWTIIRYRQRYKPRIDRSSRLLLLSVDKREDVCETAEAVKSPQGIPYWSDTTALILFLKGQFEERHKWSIISAQSWILADLFKFTFQHTTFGLVQILQFTISSVLIIINVYLYNIITSNYDDDDLMSMVLWMRCAYKMHWICTCIMLIA